MEIFKLNETNIVVAAAQAAATIRTGGVILYPTDTLYGLGVDALSDEAVAKIYAIKEREEGKPIHCVVSDLEMAARYCEPNDTARLLANQFLPGPLTLILKKKGEIKTGIARGIDTIGIRIPDNQFCLALSHQFDGAITTTSANKSGAEALRRVPDILVQLGASVRNIDLVVDAGELPERLSSTIMDVSSNVPRILREGAIPAEEIKRCIENNRTVV
jgi:L-threonylcarbamoyladenylate synthase